MNFLIDKFVLRYVDTFIGVFAPVFRVCFICGCICIILSVTNSVIILRLLSKSVYVITVITNESVMTLLQIRVKSQNLNWWWSISVLVIFAILCYILLCLIRPVCICVYWNMPKWMYPFLVYQIQVCIVLVNVCPAYSISLGVKQSIQ